MTETSRIIPAFPKIWALGHRFTDGIFNNPVEITEKIDGSQFSFGRIDGRFQMRSKGQEVFDGETNALFKGAIATAMERAHMIEDGVVVHGEAVSKRKHNVLSYGRVPDGNFIMFAVRKGAQGPGQFQNSVEYAEYLGLEHVPVLCSAGVRSWTTEELLELLDTTSCLGTEKIEGFVVKNYSKDILIGDQYIPITCGKFVSERFKERHVKEDYGGKVTKNGVAAMGLSLRTEARWLKAVQHLAEKGELVDDVQDIGKLFKEVQIDIEAEEKDNLKEELWKLFGPELKRSATSGIPEWYKERLLSRATEKNDE